MMQLRCVTLPGLDQLRGTCLAPLRASGFSASQASNQSDPVSCDVQEVESLIDRVSLTA